MKRKTSTYFLTGIISLIVQLSFSATASGTFTSNKNPFSSFGLSDISPTALIGYYTLDGSAQDSIGNNAGTLHGPITPVANRHGVAGKALDFNGSSNFISTTKSYSNPGPFSVSIWFKTTTNVGGALIGFSSQQTGTGGRRDRFIYMNAAGKLVAGVAPSAKKESFTTTKSYNDGKWHMATLTVGAGGFTLYVDGQVTNSLTKIKTAENYTGYWRIGHDDLDTWPGQPSSFFFKGSLDDALIFNRELSEEEVANLYNPQIVASVNKTCFGQNIGRIEVSGTDGVPGYQYNINGGAYSKNNVFNNLSAGNHTIGIRDTNNVENTRIVNVGVQSLATVSDSGVVGFYKLNNSAADFFNLNPGAFAGSPAPIADRFGRTNNAMNFSGVNQHLYTSEEIDNPQEFTLSIWFKTNTTTGGKLIGFGKSKTGLSTQYDRHIYMNNAGQVFFAIFNKPVTIAVNTAESYNDNNWHHALATFSSGGLYLFIDGVLKGQNTNSYTAENYKGYWRVGGDNMSAWPSQPSSNYFKGILDEAIIYNRVLSSGEITELYRSAEGAGNNGPACSGGQIQLTAGSMPGASYSWAGPGGFTSSLQNPSILFTTAGAGAYTVTATSASGCVMTAQTIVSGINNPGQWVGAISNDWNTAANWCDGVVPGNTTDVTITTGVVNMPRISGVAAVRNLTIESGATVTTLASGTLNITGLLTNDGSMINQGITAFVGTSGVQTYSGVPSFHHLKVANPAGLQLPDSVKLVHLTLETGYLTSNNKNITITGNWTNNSGVNAFVPGAARVTFAGTTAQTIGGNFSSNFYNLYASNKASVVTLANNVVIQNNLFVEGTLNLATFNANRATNGGILSVTLTGNLIIGGSNTLPANFATRNFHVSSIVEYAGTNQTVAGETYGTLIFSSSSGNAVKTAAATHFRTQADFIMRKGTGTSVSFSNLATLTIGRKLWLESGATLQANSSEITVNGDWENNGTFNGHTGKVILGGSNAIVFGTGAQNFNDLAIAGTYITFTNHTITVAGNFETAGAGFFTQAEGGTLVMIGKSKTIKGTGISIENLTISSGGTITIHPSLAITGNLTVTGTTDSLKTGANSYITMSGADKTISGNGAMLFNVLNVTGSVTSSANFQINNALNVDGTFTATSKTATFTGTTVLSGKADLYTVAVQGTSLQMASNSYLGIANTLAIQSGSAINVTSSAPNTIAFNKSGAQSVNPIMYDILVIKGAGVKTAAGALTVNNSVRIESGATLNGGNYVHTIYGHWNNAGTYMASTGTVKFVGTGTSAVIGYTEFNIVTVEKASTSATVNLGGNIKTGTLNMLTGIMETGANKVEITNTRTGNGPIWGNIQRTHAFTTGVSYAFGQAQNTLSFVSPSGIGSVTVTMMKDVPTGFPASASIQRWYQIAIPSGTFASATWRQAYDDDFLNGNNEATLEMWNNRTSTWAPDKPKTGYDLTANYVEVSGLTDLSGKWTLSGWISELAWTGQIDSDWHKAGNWQEAGAPSSRVPGQYDIASIGTVSFSNQPHISANASVKNISLGSTQNVNLTIGATGSLISGDINSLWTGTALHKIQVGAGAMEVKGNLVLGNGNASNAAHLEIGTGTMQVRGDIKLPTGSKVEFLGTGILKVGRIIDDLGGVLIPGAGTVEYNGTFNQEISPVAYHHLVVNKSAGLSFTLSDLTISGNLTVAAGRLTNRNRLIVQGDVNIQPSAVLENKQIVEVAGNWNNSGTYDAAGENTIFNGTGTQTISASHFNNLEFDKPVGSLAVLSGDVIIKGSLVGTSGTLDIKNFFFNREIVGGSATMSDDATLIIGANNAPTKFGNYYMAPQSTIIFNGTATQVLQLPGLVYGNVIFQNAGVKQLTIPITVAGNLLIENGSELRGGNNSLTLLGDWENQGTLIPEASSVIWRGQSKEIKGVTNFNKVIVSGEYSITSNLTFNDSLEIATSGKAFSSAGINFLLHGNLVNMGTLQIAGNAVFSGLKQQHMKLINSVTNIYAVTFNGHVPPVMVSTSAPVFNILNINNTGGITPGVGWTVLNQMNISAGAAFYGGPYAHRMEGDLTNAGIMTSSGSIRFTPSREVNINFGTGFTSTGMVNFSGSGKINMAGQPAGLAHVLIMNTNAAGIAPSSDWTVTNNLQIFAGSIFQAGAHTYYIGGDLMNYGTLNSLTSRFQFNGTGNQHIESGSPFHNVRIQKASGNTELTSDLTIGGTLDFVSGKLTTDNNTIFIADGGSITNASASTGWVNGHLNKYIQSSAEKTFDVGDDTYYTPVDIEFGNIITAGGLTVTSVAGEHPQIETSMINPTKSINRYYQTVSTGLQVDTYHPRLHFVSQDEDPGINLEEVYIGLYNGSSWVSDFEVQYEAPASLRATWVNTFGDIAIGQICNMGSYIRYAKDVFCTNEGMAPVIGNSSLGGVFSAEAGLSLDASNGLVTLGASLPGEYVVTYFVAATPGCREFISRTSLIVGVEGMWSGKVNSDWSNAANWSCGGVPAPHSDVTIPTGAANNPLIQASAAMNNLEIQTGASVKVTGTMQLGGSISNAGVLNLQDGTLELTGTNPQSIAGSAFVNHTIENLKINNYNATGVSLTDSLNLTGELTSSGQGFTFHTNGHLTLKSSASGSASVGNMDGNTITGDVTVENYMSAHKSWRLLSIPTNTTQSIKGSWQEGAIGTLSNPIPGYGTQIMSNRKTWEADGFDVYAGGGPSMKTWNQATGAWVGVTSTYNPINFSGGYMILIRGDRLSNAFNSPVTQTVLRTKGPLKTGTQPKISLLQSGYASIGNPYAAPVDFTKVIRTEGVDNLFYAWDPMIRGTYNLGGYQTISAVNDWKPIPGGSYEYQQDVPAKTIASGQAVLVHTTPVIAVLPHNYEIQFTEAAKDLNGNSGNLTTGRGERGAKDKQLLRVTLYAVTPGANIVADGNVAAFSPSYSNAVDGTDAIKLMAGGENFGLKRDNKILSIEARKDITEADTLHYHMTNMAKKPYRLLFEPVKMERAGLDAYLIDKFTNNVIPISLKDTIGIDVQITTAAGSFAADRFKVVFRPMAPLSVTITSLTASPKGQSVKVVWSTSAEEGIHRYELETSTDGQQFSTLHTVAAANKPSAAYEYAHENVASGMHYYRLRIVHANGQITYSDVVKTVVAGGISRVSVFPNPVVGGKINLLLENQPAGKYQLRLLNHLGQVIMQQTLEHSGGNAQKTLHLSDKHASGLYQLEIKKPDGGTQNIQIIH